MNIIFVAVVPGILILTEDVVASNSTKNDDSIIPKEIQPGKLTHLGSILGLFINTISISLFAFFIGYYIAINHRFEVKSLAVATVISLFMLVLWILFLQFFI